MIVCLSRILARKGRNRQVEYDGIIDTCGFVPFR
jgi:hypothetical protein